MNQRYRLGLDLGTNSIGWALLALDDNDYVTGLIKTGVRIFPDGRNPKDRTSNAVARRLARQQRRRRDRYLKRRERLMAQLVQLELMPTDPAERKILESLDPYELRAKGLDQALTLPELGRAIFHINQRRGFVSNRKGSADDNEQGKIKQGIVRLQATLDEAQCRTLGEYLAKRHAKKETTRARLNGEGAKAFYDFYVHRHMIEDELDQLWTAQQPYHQDTLTSDGLALIKDTILFQRPLRPVVPGPCTLRPDLPRAASALPSVILFRVLQELNNLVLIDEQLERTPITLEQRNLLRTYLLSRAKADFNQIRKKLKLPASATFNLESDNRSFLLGDPTGASLAHKKGFGAAWYALPLEEQDAIVTLLLTEPDEEKVITFLCERYHLEPEQAEYVSSAKLQDGHGSLSQVVILELIPHLDAEVISYADAAKRANYEHSQLYSGEYFERLPYYGQLLSHYVAPVQSPTANADELQYGKIGNPTVHIALNQVRKLVNTLIEHYGAPEQIVIEVARDLKIGEQKRKELLAENRKNQKRNEDLRTKLVDIGVAPNKDNLLKLKLWEELNLDDPANRCCIYTGEQIGPSRLFAPDTDVEIEHILPFALSLDDSIANKTLSLRRANQFKGNATPFQAFSNSPSPYGWDAIMSRVQHLPFNKRWRFAENALTRFAEDNDFLARHLTDTAYIARVAKQYLNYACPRGVGGVWVTPGRLTALLRGKWALNSLLADGDFKNRDDQRHHAIDAVVVGLTDRGLLNKISRAATDTVRGRLVDNMPQPWERFRDDLDTALDKVVVSYKPDHGVQGPLHNDTAYGVVDIRPDGKSEVVHRVAAMTLTKRKDIDKIRDTNIRSQFIDLCGDRSEIPKEELQVWLDKEGIRRLRITEIMSVVPIKDRQGNPLKAYKGDGNYCYEIFEVGAKWDGRIISTFEANSSTYQKFTQEAHYHQQTAEGEPLMMRICKGDYVAAGVGRERKIYQIVKFSKDKIVLAENNEGGALKARDSDKEDPFKYLTKSPNAMRSMGIRKVLVDPIGRVLDPGSRYGRADS